MTEKIAETQTKEADVTIALTCPECGSRNFIVSEEGHQWIDESGAQDDYHTVEHCLDCGYESSSKDTGDIPF